MDIHFDGKGQARMEDSGNLRAFKAVVPPDLTLLALAAANPALVRGVRGDDHLWLDVAGVAALGPTDIDWRAGYDKMIAYAESKGWTRGTPPEVAAHVERP